MLPHHSNNSRMEFQHQFQNQHNHPTFYPEEKNKASQNRSRSPNVQQKFEPPSKLRKVAPARCTVNLHKPNRIHIGFVTSIIEDLGFVGPEILFHKNKIYGHITLKIGDQVLIEAEPMSISVLPKVKWNCHFVQLVSTSLVFDKITVPLPFPEQMEEIFTSYVIPSTEMSQSTDPTSYNNSTTMPNLPIPYKPGFSAQDVPELNKNGDILYPIKYRQLFKAIDDITVCETGHLSTSGLEHEEIPDSTTKSPFSPCEDSSYKNEPRAPCDFTTFETQDCWMYQN